MACLGIFRKASKSAIRILTPHNSRNNLLFRPRFISARIVDVVKEDSPKIIKESVKVNDLIMAESFTDLSFYKLPSYLAINILEFLHQDLDVPWWLAIVALSIAARSIVSLLLINSNIRTLVLKYRSPELARYNKAMQRTGKTRNVERIKIAMKNLKKYKKENNVYILRPLIVTLSLIPVFLSNFYAVRSLAMGEPSFATGGILFFPNLMITETLILPAVFCIGNAVHTKWTLDKAANNRKANGNSSFMFKVFDEERNRYFISITFGLFLFVLTSSPGFCSGLTLLMITNLIGIIASRLFFDSKKFRQIYKIPEDHEAFKEKIAAIPDSYFDDKLSVGFVKENVEDTHIKRAIKNVMEERMKK